MDNSVKADGFFVRQTKSYVLRTGRMTTAQKRGWLEGWHHFGVQHDTEFPVLDVLFKHRAPVVLEIGFGMGKSLLAMAKEQPHYNFLGIEVHRPGVGALMNELLKEQLDNVKICCHDAVEVLKKQIPPSSLERVQIYFPDPWHKKKHHKRRLIQTPFIELLAEKVKVGGCIHLATDWQPYAGQMLETLSAMKIWRNASAEGGYIERPSYRPETKFEKRGRELGHGVWDLIFIRC